MSEAPSIYDRFQPGLVPPLDGAKPALWFAFCGERLLVSGSEAEVPRAANLYELGLRPVRQQYLGDYAGAPCYAAELPEGAKAPDGFSLSPLRSLFEGLCEDHFLLAGRAKQIVEWDRDHQFCGRCGAPTESQPNDRAKRCRACGLIVFPRLAPAVIVAVRRGGEILLARAARFPRDWFSVLAGFVEPGETLEEAVGREVFEEVGIRVKNIEYFGSQPWPFPHSLMVGFTAEHAAGQIRLDEAEIAEAHWFAADALPKIPGKISIARRLIDHFVLSQRG